LRMSSPYQPDEENGVATVTEEQSPRRERKEKKKKKHRSRSRSRSRRHRSRSRSREKKHSRSRSSDRKSKKSRRKKPSQFWDVPPPGFEHITPLQYKALQATGQLPVAGAALPPSILQMGENATASVSAAIAAAPMAQSHITRQARRLYLGNIPFGTTEDAMTEFFNKQMRDCGLACAAGNPVIATQINFERNFAFLELRSVEETTNCLAFDGINFMGQTLKIRRPNDYKPLPTGTTTGVNLTHIPGIVSTFVEETPNKLFIGSLPNHLNDDQVKELLTSFGQLKSFTLVKDSGSGESKGYAFCEYIDPKNTEQAIEGLNGMSLGEKKLIVNRAGSGNKNSAAAGLPLPITGMDIVSSLNEATEVLSLMNMITLDDLLDDDEYAEIIEDVREECGKHGRVRNVVIPRPIEGQAVPGQGKIYVEFATPDDCKKAAGALAGRKFANRVVVTSYYSLEKFRKRDF